MLPSFVLNLGTAHLTTALPNELREAARLGAKARSVVVIVSLLTVPSVDGVIDGTIPGGI